MIDRDEGSSATKQRYLSLYATDSITMEELCVLMAEEDSRRKKILWDNMTLSEKVLNSAVTLFAYAFRRP